MFELAVTIEHSTHLEHHHEMFAASGSSMQTRKCRCRADKASHGQEDEERTGSAASSLGHIWLKYSCPLSIFLMTLSSSC